ncbi:MAG: carotenoid biosynthesis protein, partial [Bacteroidia bacterium]|nr:carotenoid biosynthesis protein [Bacteroidia bacterium]
LGASVLTFLDFFIEPIAIKYDYWTWQATEVPTQNYIAWFIASFLFLLFFYILKFNKNNKIALLLYITQLLFFVFLNLF